MVTSKIIKKLHQKYPALNRSQIVAIFDVMFNTISESLIEEKPVELRDFGRFSTKTIKAKYNARNPKTGEKVHVKQKKTIYWKMSKEMFNKINNVK